MGFGEILQIVQSVDTHNAEFQTLNTAEDDLDEGEIKVKVLEAHKALVALNAKNQETFKELIQSLEAAN